MKTEMIRKCTVALTFLVRAINELQTAHVTAALDGDQKTRFSLIAIEEDLWRQYSAIRIMMR